MRDCIELCSSPCAEDCAQVGSPDYYDRAKKECRIFIDQLRRQFGPEPDGARLFVKSNSHDFGTYHEVACRFNTDLPESADYAFRLDNELPERWDEQALAELATIQGVPS